MLTTMLPRVGRVHIGAGSDVWCQTLIRHTTNANSAYPIIRLPAFAE